MKKTALLLLAVVAGGCSSAATSSGPRPSFFLTSVGSGQGANLGGVAGADRHCTMLADAAGFTGRTWRAYLSQPASGGTAAINARDRIGSGPWYNVKNELIASNVADLHGENAKWTKQTVLNEKGLVTNGRGDTPNRDDMLTGSQLDGTAYPSGTDTTCGNYTSSAATGSVRVGHFDKVGGGENPTSWNSAHASRGCGQTQLQGSGGEGYFYCFAIN
ncbi:MAG: hypothetical protein WEE89_18875 [Gemmatimonadota bacterium]